MLGINKLSSGRMGNRLFHYHFLRQISEKTGIGYFNVNFPESKYFEELNKHKRKFLFFRRQVKIGLKEIKEMGPDNFLKFLKEKNELGFDILLSPPILGEVFFDYLFYRPGDFLKIKKEYQKDFNFPIEGKLIIGLYFRGTDFESWNSHASLKFDYYQKAIKTCVNEFADKKLIFVLFTDDLKFKTYLEARDYLKENSFEFYISDNLNLPICDFYQISQCDVLVSSPSTFAILAGAIGKSKKIIHSKEWLDYSISRDDKFWVDLARTNNPYYSLWKSL